jgi:hypothetical protein
MPLLLVEARRHQNRRSIAESKRRARRDPPARIRRAETIQVAPVVNDPNFARRHSLGADQVTRRRVRHRDIFIHQTSDLPIHPEAAAQHLAHPPHLGPVTGLEHRADSGHPPGSRAE